MADYRSMHDPDQDNRRQLLAAARNGQETASVELQREYHVRVYSPDERAALYYDALPQTKHRRSKDHLVIETEWVEIADLGASDTDLL